MGRQKRTEKGLMITGLTQTVRTRQTDLDTPPRWNYDTLVSVNRPEPKVYCVVYTTPTDDPAGGYRNRTAHLATSQMSLAEMRSLLAFLKDERPDVVEPVVVVADTQDEQKPKADGKVRVTGIEHLERKYRGAEPSLSESVRDTALVVPETKYVTARVVKTYTVTYEETHLLKFTEKTLQEFEAMATGNEEDKMVYNYLLRKQTARVQPVTCKEISSTKPTFRMEEP